METSRGTYIETLKLLIKGVDALGVTITYFEGEFER